MLVTRSLHREVQVELVFDEYSELQPVEQVQRSVFLEPAARQTQAQLLQLSILQALAERVDVLDRKLVVRAAEPDARDFQREQLEEPAVLGEFFLARRDPE